LTAPDPATTLGVVRWTCILAVGAWACSFAQPRDRPDAGSGTRPPVDAVDARVNDAPPDASPAPFELTGMQWSIPCTGPIAGNPPGCFCDMTSASYARVVTLQGDGSAHYTVTAQIAGVMEGFGYVGGSADGSSGWYVGGGIGTDTGDNNYAIIVSSPPQTYWLNDGSTGNSFSLPFVYTATFPVDGDATVSFIANPGDNREWQGIDGSGQPITIPDFPAPPPVGGLYGQFAYVVITSATLD
jgi:hypothetical protein